jgi:hypothetical protein
MPKDMNGPGLLRSKWLFRNNLKKGALARRKNQDIKSQEKSQEPRKIKIAVLRRRKKLINI